MKIVSIELKGYKFLALSNINFIQLRPENKLQLILGTNGSGKSSLLKECSPLPANPSEFTKDGYKLIDITVYTRYS
jgi:ABC-type cobalamin/Fe3+-siderophores transport system ATPase subunit